MLPATKDDREVFNIHAQGEALQAQVVSSHTSSHSWLLTFTTFQGV
jgi:hypothetical protein